MAKIKMQFVCQSCGYATAKWLGKCPECGQWDSFVEEVLTVDKSKSFLPIGQVSKPKTISSIAIEKVARMATGIAEFDRVLGGGIVPGSLILLAGDPGIGKSTIALDAGIKFSDKGVKVIYVSGEESEAQTAMRAQRLGKAGENLLIMSATDLTQILVQAQAEKPRILVIDSIQTMFNS